MRALLDNIVWHTLAGPHARFAVGSGGARRYARGFSPIVGFETPDAPDFDALGEHCSDDEHFYCDGWSGPAPHGWRIDAETTMFKMIWDAVDVPADETGGDAVTLGPPHVDSAMALAMLTRPGPFGPRTIELGDYYGIFDHGRLVAMAGERMHAGPLREISGVCTHPSFQGRGYARRLMTRLMHRQRLRGETPFLHVMRDNAGARALYARMGFSDVRESVVRVISRH